MDSDVQAEATALVERSFTCVLGTIGPKGDPQMKALIKTSSSGLREFWFCSNTDSKRAAQILKNPNASLYFYNEESFEGLMLSGKAEISYDDLKRNEFWHERMKVYYPLGPADPDYALIKFTAHSGNYYHKLRNVDFAL